MPITLSGNKYVLNKVYVLNKQVSKYMVMPFFANNTSIPSFVLNYWLWIYVTMHTLCAFRITTTNARLYKARPKPLHGAEEPRTRYSTALIQRHTRTTLFSIVLVYLSDQRLRF